MPQGDADKGLEGDGIGDFVRSAMIIEVHPDLMRRAMRAHAEMSPEGRGDLTMQLLSPIKVVHGLKRVKKRDRAALGHALYLRIAALARLSARPEFRGYATEEVKDGAVFIRDELIVAAASAPLIATDKHTIEFDADALFQIMLRDGPHDGTA